MARVTIILKYTHGIHNKYDSAVNANYARVNIDHWKHSWFH